MNVFRTLLAVLAAMSPVMSPVADPYGSAYRSISSGQATSSCGVTIRQTVNGFELIRTGKP